MFVRSVIFSKTIVANPRMSTFEKCLNTANIKDAINLAKAHYKTWFEKNTETTRKEKGETF